MNLGTGVPREKVLMEVIKHEYVLQPKKKEKKEKKNNNNIQPKEMPRISICR